MRKRCHPGYRNLLSESNWEEVRERARLLPEHGIPPGLVNIEYLPSSDDKDGKPTDHGKKGKKQMKQSQPLAVSKAAVPPEPPDAVGKQVHVPRALGLVEGEAATDSGIRDAESVAHLEKELGKGAAKGAVLDVEEVGTKITLANGSDMLDQFAPWFATIAFPYLLPLGTGGADFYGKARRRKAHHPRVDLGEWFDHCLRRVELQFRRDNVFAFTIFNVAFRALISKGTYPMINSRMAEGVETIRAEQWAKIARVLRDGFVKESGGTRKVAGRLDMAVRAEGLDDTTRRLLRVVDTACASVPVSPNDRHSTLVLRYARARHNDPVVKGREQLFAIDKPSFEGEVEFDFPDYEQRRDIAAQDPTGQPARRHSRALLSELIGVRICPWCPNCSGLTNRRPCVNPNGSVAKEEGGILGMCKAYYGCVETQRQDPKAKEDLKQRVLTRYASFKESACRESYATRAPSEEELAEFEVRWPDYAGDNTLVSRPEYQSKRPSSDVHVLDPDDGNELRTDAREWKKAYLKDIRENQLRFMHHIHLPDADGERVPLRSCEAHGKPGECKHGFPFKSTWRRSQLGCMVGPRDDMSAFLQKGPGAIIAGARHNCDLRLLHRLCVTQSTHCKTCPAGDQCPSLKAPIAEQLSAMQLAQELAKVIAKQRQRPQQAQPPRAPFVEGDGRAAAEQGTTTARPTVGDRVRLAPGFVPKEEYDPNQGGTSDSESEIS
eukprot:gene57731-biopygen78075